MNRRLHHFLLAQITVFFCTATAVFGEPPTRCETFSLLDFRGQKFTLADAKTPLKVVAFLGTECPLAKLYSQRLNRLAAEYEEQLAVIGVISNYQDSNSDIANFAKRHEIRFPMLKDLQNKVADEFKARRTPEVYLLDGENRVRYHGRIDDQYGVGYARAKPIRSELREAIEDLIAGREVAVPETEAVGCFIGRVPKATLASENSRSDITYGEHIVPILERFCVECHQEGEIAPFSLTSYDEVIGWGETIREVVEDRRMPPWHANPEVGEFINARALPDKEKDLLIGWIEAGMPKGDTDREPQVPVQVAGWRLPREPDAVFSMNENGFEVPAEGTVEYQYFVVDPELTEDKWITAAEVIPGNRSVVHHAIVFVRPPQGERQDGIGWLTAYVPGQTLMELPDGFARRVPAGSKLVFQMHYTPTGAVERDNTKIGLLFGDRSKINTEVQTRIVINRDFEIPPQDPSYVVKMSADRFPAGSQLFAISPHMHYRGSQFEVSAQTKNTDDSNQESTKILLDVPNYDFNWQHAYLLKERLPLEDVRINCRAVFDNSADNPVNPKPSDTVRWGDQTWEEMALAYLAIAIPLDIEKRSDFDGKKIISDDQVEINAEYDPKTLEERATRITKDFFEKLDKNDDGEILRAETPKSFRAFAWGYYDQNGDYKLTWEEVLNHARASLQP